ncbi:hypothetical protein [Streptomyces sp. NPDC008240]|uniref:hypothetical protein n=1 Tax=Streptomyces sp. NPDC008240 TaxID=3364822 RepID=UPI0036EF9550
MRFATFSAGEAAKIRRTNRREGKGYTVADISTYGYQADRKAELAAGRQGEDKQTDAIGEGLAAIAYALLDIAATIRENTEAR